MKIVSLDQSPLYRLASRQNLAQLFDVDMARLESLANGHGNYRTFTSERSGKIRHVQTPVGSLEVIHTRLYQLLDKIEKPAYLQSGVKGRSYLTNARAHDGHVRLIQIDIKKYFQAIDTARLGKLFVAQFQCSRDVAAVLAKLCTVDGSLPIGSRASQQLAFFASKPMLDDLHALSCEVATCFTCYVDNLTFSGAGAGGELLWRVKKAIHRHGFGYHEDRCHEAGESKVVTGVQITGKGLRVVPQKALAIWTEMNELKADRGPDRLARIDRLLGQLSAATQIEPQLVRHKRRLLAMKRAEQSRCA